MEVYKDFFNCEVNLSEEAWEHISQHHIEIRKEVLRKVLESPDVILEDKRPRGSICRFLMFFQIINRRPARYHKAVVKYCPDGNFVVSAYTTDRVFRDVVFRKEEQ